MLIEVAMKLTPEKLTAFCAALAETGNVTRSCAAVGISRTIAYEWRDLYPAFSERWDKALRIGVVGKEDEAKRRAFEGVEEPLTHQGQFTYLYERDEKGQIIFDEEIIEREVVTKAGKSIETEVLRTPRMLMGDDGQPKLATVRKYSDTLTIFLLKAHDPKYRDSSKLEMSGS